MSSFVGFNGFADDNMDDESDPRIQSIHDLEDGDDESVEFKIFVTTKTADGIAAQEVEEAISQAIQDSAPSELDVVSVSATFREDEAEELEMIEGADLSLLWIGEAFINLNLPDTMDNTKSVVDNVLMEIDVQDDNAVCHDIVLSLED